MYRANHKQTLVKEENESIIHKYFQLIFQNGDGNARKMEQRSVERRECVSSSIHLMHN